MFSQLFFLFLALTLITFMQETDLTFWVEDPFQALQWGLRIYAALLLLLWIEAKFLTQSLKGYLKPIWWPFINLQILLFLGLYHFGLGAQRFFLQGPLASYQTPYTFISLLLYFFALNWGHAWYSYCHLQLSLKQSWKNAWYQLLFLVPFSLPFLILSMLIDGLEHLPAWQQKTFSINHDILLLIFSLCLVILTLVFLPACIVFCWRCNPIERFDLKGRLEDLCSSLHFRHAGLKIWSVMPHSFTAGIIGIIPAFRYILFTPALLKRFKVEEIEAILVHEIGHNRYKHLLLYPFIMLGMVVLGALLMLGLEESLSSVLPSLEKEIGYFLLLMGLFILYAILMGLYFRLVFGFFSRLFERQADLYIFESRVSPIYLIQALDRLGVITGYTHSHPSWHHFSLQNRIRFLYQAIDKPHLIQQHHQRVKKWLILYFLGLFLSCFTLYVYFA